MPTVGAAVGLVMARSWTDSGNQMDGRQPRREDETANLCEHPARRAASLVQGSLKACAAALLDPARAVSGSLGEPILVTRSTSPRPDPDTHRARGAHDVRSIESELEGRELA